MKEFELFAEDIKSGVIYNVTKQANAYMKKSDVIRLGKLNNRALEMYLYRNKNIQTKKPKDMKEKLISIKILDYALKSASKSKI